MSTNPIDPVFDSTSFPRGDGQSENGHAAHARPDATAGAASSELGTIADAIEELLSSLAQAQEQLARGALEDTTEVSRIFEEAQRFSEACLSKLEMRIRGILFQAEVKAAEVLREADEEAAEILRQAQQASFVPEGTADELQAAIVAFATVNSELVKKLTALNDMLTPTVWAGSASTIDPPDGIRSN
jgi:dsDNA-specific endonuclease/ATPase MutS2